jgi:lipoprotein-releasing system permease protein
MSFYERKMGRVYLRSARRVGFLSVMGRITVIGILLGVMALVVALSFASGFQSALRDKIIGINAHLLLMRYDGGVGSWQKVRERIEGMPGVQESMPFTYHQGMLRSEKGVSGTIVRGILPEQIEGISGMEISFVCGGMASPVSPAGEAGSGGEGHARAEVPGPESIWVGKVLAETLEVTCGDPVSLIALSDASMEGGDASLRTYRIAGVFDVGMYEYDASLAFLRLPEAQQFYGMGDEVTGIEIRLDDIGQTDALESRIVSELGYPFWVKNWREINPNFFSALRLQKVVMFLILILIVLVGGFNIISTLIMSVIEKRREIAILKAMGTTRRSIGRIFFYQGLVLGLVGTGLGLAGGVLFCRLSQVLPMIRLDPEVYYLAQLPVEMRMEEFVLVGVASVVLTLLSTLYPARQAAKLDPAEVLRYE